MSWWWVWFLYHHHCHHSYHYHLDMTLDVVEASTWSDDKTKSKSKTILSLARSHCIFNPSFYDDRNTYQAYHIIKGFTWVTTMSGLLTGLVFFWGGSSPPNIGYSPCHQKLLRKKVPLSFPQRCSPTNIKYSGTSPPPPPKKQKPPGNSEDPERHPCYTATTLVQCYNTERGNSADL